MFFGEVTFFARLDVDDADHAVLDDQRDGQFGVNVRQGFNVEIFLRGIGDQHGLTSFGGASGNALADLDAQAVGDSGRIAHVEADVQFLPSVR